MKIKNLYYAIVGARTIAKEGKGLKLKPNKDNLLEVVTIDDAEISIHYVPDINKLGVAGCALMHNVFNLCKRDYIAVDNYYMNMPSEIQEAMIAHELGHWQLGHLKNKGLKTVWSNCVQTGIMLKGGLDEQEALIKYTLLNRDYTQELDADAYAIERCGNENGILGFLIAFNTLAEGTCDEIHKRYEYITGEKMPGADNTLDIIAKKISEAPTVKLEDLDID